MHRFRRIRYDGKTVALQWAENPSDTTTISPELVSSDTPEEAFKLALQALAPLVGKLLGLPKAYAEHFEVRSVAIDEKQAPARRGLVVNVTRPIVAANGPLNISTPRVVENDPEEGGPAIVDKMMEALDLLSEEAVRFYNQTREQAELFEDEEETEEDVATSKPQLV